jgi:hypothetical protein
MALGWVARDATRGSINAMPSGHCQSCVLVDQRCIYHHYESMEGDI